MRRKEEEDENFLIYQHLKNLHRDLQHELRAFKYKTPEFDTISPFSMSRQGILQGLHLPVPERRCHPATTNSWGVEATHRALESSPPPIGMHKLTKGHCA